MAVAALITWIATALGGFYLLGTWLQKGGTRQQGGPSRFPTGLIFGHFGVAAVGLVLWLIYAFSDSDGLAWTALVFILAAATLGLVMFARWYQARKAPVSASVGGSGQVAAEQQFPVWAVAGHGAVAVLTVVLVIIAVLAD